MIDIGKRKLYVRRVPAQCQPSDLKAVLRKFGKIEECVVKQAPNANRKFALVLFKELDAAANAIDANPHELLKSKIYLDYCDSLDQQRMSNEKMDDKYDIQPTNSLLIEENEEDYDEPDDDEISERTIDDYEYEKKRVLAKDLKSVALNSYSISTQFVISHVSDSLKFVFSDFNHLSALLNVGQDDFSSSETVTRVEIGDVVIVLDGAIHFRAEVIAKLSADECRVKIVDVGGEENVKLSDLKWLNKKWKELEYATFALRVRGSDKFDQDSVDMNRVRQEFENTYFELTWLSKDGEFFDGTFGNDKKSISQTFAKLLGNDDCNKVSVNDGKRLTEQKIARLSTLDSKQTTSSSKTYSCGISAKEPSFSSRERCPSNSTKKAVVNQNRCPTGDDDCDEKALIQMYKQTLDNIAQLEDALRTSKKIEKHIEHMLRS